MLDPSRGFAESVVVTIPWLHSRTLGGTLMTVAHLVFAVHAWMLSTSRGPVREAEPWVELPATPVGTEAP
jgi:cytochrome c oxidase cbb3-type subunit 1